MPNFMWKYSYERLMNKSVGIWLHKRGIVRLQTMSIPKVLLVKSVHLASILAKLPGNYSHHTKTASYLHTYRETHKDKTDGKEGISSTNTEIIVETGHNIKHKKIMQLH